MDFIQRFFCAQELAFLRYAFAAGLLASLSLGVVGTFVVTRRIASLSGAISHCVLGGIGFALYAQVVWGWVHFSPMLGAFLSALLAAFLMGYISKKAQQREDTLIGALWSVGMAVGILFLAKTPAYVDPMAYLFGNILMTGPADLIWLTVLGVGVIAVAVFLYQPLLALCFDEEFAALRGVRTHLLYGLILALVASSIVLMIPIVGLVMVIALLTLPAAIAGQFSRTLWQMMLVATLVSALAICAGLWSSYVLNLPAGGAIVAILGVFYGLSLGIKHWRSRAAQ